MIRLIWHDSVDRKHARETHILIGLFVSRLWILGVESVLLIGVRSW